MLYCTKCGAVVEGHFCRQCGTALNPAPEAPQAQPTPPPAAGAIPTAQQPPVMRKTSPLKWVLVGCAGIIAIGAIVAISLGFFVVHKVRQAGLDPELMKRNPALAVTKMITAFNPGLDIVSVEEDSGRITVREKSTGKLLTMNFEDVRKGKLVFTDEKGEEVSVETHPGGDHGSVTVKTKEGVVKVGAQWSPPAWLPAYSGARIETGTSSESPSEKAGTASFLTNDSGPTVLNFYEQALRKDGFEVQRNTTGTGGTITVATLSAQSEDHQRSAGVTAISGEGETRITLTYSIKN